MEMNLFNRKNEINIMLIMLIYENIDERLPYFLLLTLLFLHMVCVFRYTLYVFALLICKSTLNSVYFDTYVVDTP